MWPKFLRLILESNHVFLPNIFPCSVFSMKSCTGWAHTDYMFLNFIDFTKGHCFVWYASVCELARCRPLECRISVHASGMTSSCYRWENEASGNRDDLPVFT